LIKKKAYENEDDDDDDEEVEIEVDEKENEDDYLEEGEYIINSNKNSNPKIKAIKSNRLDQQSEGEDEVCLQITSTSSNKSKLINKKKSNKTLEQKF
jgi:hypothetical protein